MSELVFDHVGIAVADLDESLGLWKTLGAICVSTEVVESQQVRVAFLDTGATKTELLEPTSESSPIARFLATGKKGIHHIAYRVPDISQTLDRLRSEGVPLIHDTPIEGSRGTQIAFLHPKGTGGVLTELIQYPSGATH